jgi:methylase of polypeptide subunit release factors
MSAIGLRLKVGFRRFVEQMPPLLWLSLLVAGAHFGVDAVSLLHGHVWDATSLLLRKGIRRYAWGAQRALDLGTGHIGLLAVYCARAHGCDVVAVDVNEEFVKNARYVAMVNGVSGIDFRASDWFSNVDGTFDLIFGNVPYVPTEVGYGRFHDHSYPEIWNGGNDGLDHERSVLAEAGRYLNPDGSLLLGVDTRHIPRASTVALIETMPDLALKKIVKSWVSASEIYVIGLKPGGETC